MFYVLLPLWVSRIHIIDEFCARQCRIKTSIDRWQSSRIQYEIFRQFFWCITRDAPEFAIEIANRCEPTACTNLRDFCVWFRMDQLNSLFYAYGAEILRKCHTCLLFKVSRKVRRREVHEFNRIVKGDAGIICIDTVQ